MKKRSISLLLMLLLLWSNAAAAQGEKVGMPRLSMVDAQQDTAIDVPQPGTIKTTIPFTAGDTDANMYLIVALFDDITNSLVAVDVQADTAEAGSTTEIEAQIPVKSMDGYSYRYYLWDSVQQLRPYKIPEPEPAKETLPIASVTMEQIPVSEGILFKDGGINAEGYSPGDYRTEYTIYHGRPCRASKKYEVGANTFRTSIYYFTVDKNYVAPTEKNVTFEVTYFDNGTGGIAIEYLGPDVGNKRLSKANIARKNTNTWQTATVSVTNANFIEGGVDWISFGAQFRISGGENTYIHSVKVYPTQNAQYRVPFVQLGEGMMTYQMAYARQDETVALTYEKRDCDKTAAGGKFPFDMCYPKADEKEALYPLTNVQAEVDLTYYDDGADGDILLDYHSDAGQRTISAAKRAVQGWTTVTAKLQDAVFDRAIDGHDFAVYADNAELYLQSVTVRIIPPKTGRLNFQEGTADGLDFFLRTGDESNLAAISDAYTTEKVVGPDEDRRKVRHAATFLRERDGVIQQSYKYLYLLVDDALMFGAAYPKADVSITYYDVGKGKIDLQYNAAGNAYKGVALGTKTNTKEWKTATVRVSDAMLTNAQGMYCADFRICVADADANDNSVAEEDKLQGLYVSEVTITPVAEPAEHRPVLYLIGDSICQGYASDSIRKGWGEYIGKYLTNDITVENYAVAGRSSKNFLDTGNFDTILRKAKPGDYLFIQFGHNDSMSDPNRHTDVSSTAQDHSSYSYNLQYYAKKAWEKGMHPVFLTSIRSFKTFANDGTVTDDGIDPYRNEMISVGNKIGVPVVDAGLLHRTLMNDWGTEASQRLCDDLNDGNHLNAKGAEEIAKLILRGVQGNPNIRILQSCIDPKKSLTAIKPE